MAGPLSKGAKFLFDLSKLREVPGVPQFPLERYDPPRGRPKTLDSITTPENARRLEEIARQGMDMGGPEWYNLEPLRQQFVAEMGDEEGNRLFRRYVDYVAATSPRSKVDSNIRRGSYFYNREMQGLPVANLKNADLPKGYGHLAHETQNALLRDLEGGGSFAALNRPKTSSFAENLAGNQVPMTLDTHNMALVSGKKVSPSDTQYKYLEEFQAEIADKIGLTPAQFQASLWVAGDTGVANPRPFMEIFDQVVERTAQRDKKSKNEALRDFITGKAPLFGLGGAMAGVITPEEAEAAGLGALIRRGIPESTARKIASGELPMDLGDRMERAREQRKARRLYHAGSPELAESLQLDPDAGRFARAGSGTWMSPEPILANTYMPGDISEAGTMYQMVVDDSQFPTVFARGNNWDEVEGDLIGPDGEVILENVSGTTNDIARQVREMGYPGLIFNGITDVGPNYRAAKRSSEMIAEQYGLDPADMLKESIGDTADYEVYTVFDPSVARFPTAAFDPEQASSGNLMAGVGAGAVGAGLMASDEVSASPLDRLDDVPEYMRRLDGTVKSERGFLGPIRNNVSGKTMTEVSIGQPGSEEGFYPLLVPTLTPEEVETIANMDLERERPPFSIIEKARAHAMERIDRGLSPFYQDGEEGGEARSPLERPEDVERRANARAVAVASDTLERLRRERGPRMAPLRSNAATAFGDYLTENRPSEMDPVQRALQNLDLYQGLGEYIRTVGEGQRTTLMQDINAALDVVPL